MLEPVWESALIRPTKHHEERRKIQKCDCWDSKDREGIGAIDVPEIEQRIRRAERCYPGQREEAPKLSGALGNQEDEQLVIPCEVVRYACQREKKSRFRATPTENGKQEEWAASAPDRSGWEVPPNTSKLRSPFLYPRREYEKGDRAEYRRADERPPTRPIAPNDQPEGGLRGCQHLPTWDERTKEKIRRELRYGDRQRAASREYHSHAVDTPPSEREPG